MKIGLTIVHDNDVVGLADTEVGHIEIIKSEDDSSYMSMNLIEKPEIIRPRFYLLPNMKYYYLIYIVHLINISLTAIMTPLNVIVS